MKMVFLKSVIAPFAMLFLHGSALAEATPVELDAAVARMSSAVYRIELFAACGYSTDKNELQRARSFALAFALQKDGLSKKITNEQYVSALLRVADKDLAASIRQRAQTDAVPSECDKAANKELWERLNKIANEK